VSTATERTAAPSEGKADGKSEAKSKDRAREALLGAIEHCAAGLSHLDRNELAPAAIALKNLSEAYAAICR